MRAVILDGYTLNPGDLDWDGFTQLCECEIFDYTPPAETVARARNAEIVIVNKTELPAGVLEQLPLLQYIGVLATGYNVVDVGAARSRGVVVTNIPAYSSDSVAQLVFAHLLNIASRVAGHSEEVRAGRWSACRDFTFHDTPLVELAGLNFGIFGFGNIGQRVAHLAQAFGMHPLLYTSRPESALPAGMEKVDLTTLLERSDVLSLHAPLTPDTAGIINGERISRMKPGAILINTSRGGLVDEPALAEALNAGHLFAAGLDVLSSEPPLPDNPLLKAKNCFITPHFAWATRQARRRLMDIAVANLSAFLSGNPQNRV